jgi:hypothetical protein
LTGALQADDDLDVPAPGSTVSLLSARRNTVALAELESWSGSSSGLVITSHMTTSPGIAQALNGQRAWACTYTQRTNTLVVFEGLVSQARPDRPELLTLTGISVVAREHRRADPRALVPCHVVLRVDEAEPVSARTVDVSRSGCRVQLPESDSLAVGELALAELTLTDATVVRTSCEVLRVDEGRSEAVLRFVDLTDPDAAAISRSVFAELTLHDAGPVATQP